jgi:hypothetical protein
MLDIPIDQIELADISELCQRGVYESETVEFKRELPGDGGRTGAWNAGGGISPSARDGLFREIVAFANAQGGTLVLGVAETKDKPARAESITPIGRVHELADRLREAARACIEPPLGSLQIQGVVTKGASEGVVLLRTAPSLAGPHRVVGSGHAFIRRGPSSVQMTMREIQDLTLDLARGAERLESQFGARETSFLRWVAASPAADEGAFRITALPVGFFPALPRISADPREFPLKAPVQYRVLIDASAFDFSSAALDEMRPIVRGVRLQARDGSTRVDVSQTGLVDMWSRGRTPDGKHFYVGPMLASYLRVLGYVDSIRSAGNLPDFEFAVEFGIAGHANVPQFGGVTRGTIILGAPNNPHSTWQVEGLPITFPRIPYRNRNARVDVLRLAFVDVLRLAFSDLFDATGEPLPWSKLELPA